MVDNLEPNTTYYVGVQGIGSPSASYTISGKIENGPYKEPTKLTADASQPKTSQTPSDQFQYEFFTVDVEKDGNYTVSVYPESTSKTSLRKPESEKATPDLHHPFSEEVYVLASAMDLPTLGHKQWSNGTSKFNDWATYVDGCDGWIAFVC